METARRRTVVMKKLEEVVRDTGHWVFFHVYIFMNWEDAASSS